MATFTDCNHDGDIATLRAATNAFMTDYTDGECTCLDSNKSNLFILPGENFYLVDYNGPFIEQPTFTVQSVLDIIDELVTPDIFLYDDAVQVHDRYNHTYTRIAGAGVNISIFPQTHDLGAGTPRVGAFFDVGRQEFVEYTALEQVLFEDDDHAGSLTHRPSELGYFDANTQRMVAYTAFNQLLSVGVDEDEDNVLPRIHRACDELEDWGEDDVVQELDSLSTDYGSVVAEVPSTDDSQLYELEGSTVPLTASNLRQLYSSNLRNNTLPISKPLLSPIVEESEPPSPGSSVAFAHRRGYIKPLSARRESFLSISTSPLSSRPSSRASSRVSTLSLSWLDTFQTSPSLMLSKIIDNVFASEVWHATPSFTITPRGRSDSDGGVHSPDRVRVRISWVS